MPHCFCDQLRILCHAFARPTILTHRDHSSPVELSMQLWHTIPYRHSLIEHISYYAGYTTQMSIRFVFPPFLLIILVFSPLKLRHEAKVCVTQMRRKNNVGPQGGSSRSPATKGKHMGPYHRDPWCVRCSFIFASVFRCNGVGVLCGGGHLYVYMNLLARVGV